MGSPKHKWVRRIVKTFAALALLAAIVALLAKPWIIPAILRWQAGSALADYWDGRLEIGEIDFRWSEPIELRNCRLTDARGRMWASVGSVRVILRNWPSTRPVLTDVEVASVNLTAYFDAGRLAAPLLTPPPREPVDWKKYVDLQSLTVRDISFSAVDDSGASYRWDGVQFASRREGAVHRATLRRSVGQDENLALTVSVGNDDLRAQGELDIEHRLSAAQTSTMLAAFDVPGVREIRGRLVARLKFDGPLDDPARIRPKGTIHLADVGVFGPHGQIARDGRAACLVQGRSAELLQLAATVCDGTLDASAAFDFDESFSCRGQAQGEGIDLLLLTRALAGEASASKGKLTFRYAFKHDGAAPPGVLGRGSVFVDDVEVVRIPVITELFRSQKFDLLRSDVNVEFVHQDSAVTLGSPAQLANRLSAFQAEPGGTFDFRQRTVDMHVYVVPLKQIQPLMHLQIIGLFGSVAQRLTRLHVRGHWDDPSDKLVTKEPLGDIQQATLEFFTGAARTGGNLGTGVLRGVGDLLKLLNGSRKHPAPAQ